MWLDISVPHKPELVWQDGDRRDPDRIKEKSRLPLTSIVDIRAGQASDVLERSGKVHDADKYMVFANDSGGSLDVEAPTAEGRDWLFRRFADLFQAYAIAQKERLEGDKITLRVMALMDAGVRVDASAAAQPTPASPAPMMSPPSRGGSYFGPPPQPPFASPNFAPPFSSPPPGFHPGHVGGATPVRVGGFAPPGASPSFSGGHSFGSGSYGHGGPGAQAYMR
jgi:hypothetical protein